MTIGTCSECGGPVIKREKRLSRRHLADRHLNEPMEDRLRKSGAIDLRDNCEIVPLEGGYVDFVAIDPDKQYDDISESAMYPDERMRGLP